VYKRQLSYITKKDKQISLLEVTVPKTSLFHTYFNSKGAIEHGDYSWQIKIPNYYKFCTKLTALLEKRILKSNYRYENFEFDLCTYTEKIQFRFHNSKLSITNTSMNQKSKDNHSTECKIPPQALVKMVFGEYLHEELKPVIVDILIEKKHATIINILFPKCESFFYSIY